MHSKKKDIEKLKTKQDKIFREKWKSRKKYYKKKKNSEKKIEGKEKWCNKCKKISKVDE